MNSRSQKTYYPNLNGLRFMAFLLVFLSHCFITCNKSQYVSGSLHFAKKYLNTGLQGVDFFFVLSGFLISLILFREKETSRDINLIYFLFRRVLRIWPLYFLVYFVGLIAENLWEIQQLPNPVYFFTFTLNFYLSHNGNNFLFFLVFLWTVAIEEQFYVIQGIIIKYFKKYFVYIWSFMLICSLAFRSYYINNNNFMVYHSISVAGNFAVGALLAYGMYYNKIYYRLIINATKFNAMVVYILLFLNLIFHTVIYQNNVSTVFEKLISSMLFGFVIIHQCEGINKPFQASGTRLVNYLGKISYGLYIYHGIIISIFIYLILPAEAQCNNLFTVYSLPLLILIITISTAAISYHYFEEPFIKLKDKFAYGK